MTPITLAAIGAGQRGADVYGRYALDNPGDVEYVAVAEPIPQRRQRFMAAHDIAPDLHFTTWEDLFDRPKLADAVVIATQDQDHVAPALAALRAGYHVLLEKPMATTLADCVALVQAAEQAGRVLQIGHVLRYTDFFTQIHDIVQSGRLGDIITVEHRENVAYWHMAHSFVRGNWRRTDETSPMILAKCCHDLDILYWVLGERVTRLSSFGSLRHFRPENAPRPDVPARCTDGCPVEADCPFSAPGIYLEHRPFRPIATSLGLPEDTNLTSFLDWPLVALAHGDKRPEAIRAALEHGPYGRCVYHSDNDVVDHQVVMMETERGTSVTLFMHGHSHDQSRTMRYDGTRATLEAKFAMQNEIKIHDHLSGKTEVIEWFGGMDGHGGGDHKLMAAFLKTLRDGTHAPLTDARASLESHLLAFAAEEARLTGCVVDMDAYRQ
ncbi:MAG: Gfo/Idh/MocA family oxidoreductase [Chloroflexi bacterium]|nr:Gfo/Idh/MocA family oxidoreductase [Chloroflexota bacterium]